MVRGLGRKVWGNETLSAPELQGYLQDQVVMVCPSASARDVMIPAPTDGMCCYLEDVDLFCSRVNGAWQLWRPNNNAGTGGVLIGNAPPAGQPLLRKVLSGNYTSSAFGDNTIFYPGGPFPNGVVAVNAQVVDSRVLTWNPWNTMLDRTAIRLNTGSGVAASLTVLSSFEFVGW